MPKRKSCKTTYGPFSILQGFNKRIENKLTLHPDWPSFNTPQGKAIRYGRESCPRTIDIIGRTGGVIMDPNFTEEDLNDIYGYLWEYAADSPAPAKCK